MRIRRYSYGSKTLITIELFNRVYEITFTRLI